MEEGERTKQKRREEGRGMKAGRKEREGHSPHRLTITYGLWGHDPAPPFFIRVSGLITPRARARPADLLLWGAFEGLNSAHGNGTPTQPVKLFQRHPGSGERRPQGS